MTGFINILKPSGMSSAYVVGAVKKKFNCPCGHMGTLDPLASGVLPVGIGQASRLFNYLLDKSKTYVATFRFGLTTDTLDITGNVISTTQNIPNKETISQNLSKFIGTISQVPPNYSAKCIDGKRGYQLARKGVEFSLPPKEVTIEDFRLIKAINDTDFLFEIDCKGGTYIRSLARDLGEACNSLCIMTALERTKSGIFNLENAITFEELNTCCEANKYIIPADESVNFDKFVLTSYQAERLLNGLYDKYDKPDGLYRIYNENAFWGVGIVKDKILKMQTYVR